MSPDVVTGFLIIITLEGVFGFFKPDLHVIHAPLEESRPHCHTGDSCADPHVHLGTYP